MGEICLFLVWCHRMLTTKANVKIKIPICINVHGSRDSSWKNEKMQGTNEFKKKCMGILKNEIDTNVGSCLEYNVIARCSKKFLMMGTGCEIYIFSLKFSCFAFTLFIKLLMSFLNCSLRLIWNHLMCMNLRRKGYSMESEEIFLLFKEKSMTCNTIPIHTHT